jgi:hypothetical protein
MNKLLMLVLTGCLLVPLMGLLAGCPTMSLDAKDHERQITRYAEIECKQVSEDWDYLWLVDEPSHLTPYHLPSKPH